MYSYFYLNVRTLNSIPVIDFFTLRLPNHRSDMFYPSCRLVFSNQPICCIFRNIEKAKCSYIKIGAKKRRTLQLIYFFESFRKYRISHNYAMPQVMPHAIPQTHAAFYPHRMSVWTKHCGICGRLPILVTQLIAALFV